MEITQEIEILLAEDNASDADLTMRGLKKANVLNPVHWVKDGQEALNFLFCEGEYANRKGMQPPRLILLDLKMPKVSGVEVLQKIKADNTLKTIPAVIMTSSAEEPDIANAYQLGVNSYIVKPIDFSAFAKAVAQIGMYWMMINRAKT